MQEARWRDDASWSEAHDALRRLYDIQLAPAHSTAAEHQFDRVLMAVRVEVEQAWITHELAGVFLHRSEPMR